jgi:CrcB protein
MTAFVGILTALAGGLGAACRMFVDAALNRRPRTIPIGTFGVNVTACLAMGLVSGVALAAPGDTVWLGVIGTGLLGGYSTFSTAMVESARLLRAGRVRAGLAHGLGMLLVSLVALLAGQGTGLVLLG